MSRTIEVPDGPAVVVVFGNGTTSVGHAFAVWWDDQFGTRANTAHGADFKAFVESVEGIEIPSEDDGSAWEQR